MDARVTQKAFVHWYSNFLLPSTRGKEVSIYARREFHNLISNGAPNPINRYELLPETLEVIIAWENEPIPFASVQWRRAQIRLIADLLLKGTLMELHDHPVLSKPLPNEIDEARCWIYQQPDGKYVRYQPLAQPWCTKEIPWPYNDDIQVKLANPSTALKSVPIAWTIMSMNDVRISTDVFKELVRENHDGLAPRRYKKKGTSADDKSESELHLDWSERHVQRSNRIKDWLELALHSTKGCADEGWMDMDLTEVITPDIEFDPKGIEGLREIDCCWSAFSPPPTPTWTAINDPLTKESYLHHILPA